MKRLYDRLGIRDLSVYGTHIGGRETHVGTTLPFLQRHLQPVRPTN